jgi:hypothetical protein
MVWYSFDVESARCRKHLAMNVHAMMLDIVCARQLECRLSCDGEADRGSDLGDDLSDVESESDTEPRVVLYSVSCGFRY